MIQSEKSSDDCFSGRATLHLGLKAREDTDDVRIFWISVKCVCNIIYMTYMIAHAHVVDVDVCMCVFHWYFKSMTDS